MTPPEWCRVADTQRTNREGYAMNHATITAIILIAALAPATIAMHPVDAPVNPAPHACYLYGSNRIDSDPVNYTACRAFTAATAVNLCHATDAPCPTLLAAVRMDRDGVNCQEHEGWRGGDYHATQSCLVSWRHGCVLYDREQSRARGQGPWTTTHRSGACSPVWAWR